MKHKERMSEAVAAFVREGVEGEERRGKEKTPSNPQWERLRAIGSELWLDSGDIDEIGALWTSDFTALTTNNTLLNKEVQKGQYDELIGKADKLLSGFDLSEREKAIEIAFILNAHHALRLVHRYDAFVSVEEHTEIAFDENAILETARRFHSICPERFIVKIPLTPEGIMATRRASEDGIPVNHTLGFSARQNFLVASLGKPAFVNVFLGRLGSFVEANNLGSGRYVGEKATIASQQIVRGLRERHQAQTRQIAASLRTGEQVRDLAGVDVLTMPPRVAAEFLALGMDSPDIRDCSANDYDAGIDDKNAVKDLGLDVLWSTEDGVYGCVEEFSSSDFTKFTADDLLDCMKAHGCSDLLVRWTEEQRQMSSSEGKIPKLADWDTLLREKVAGLDALMNLAGLESFAADQRKMDEHVAAVLSK